MQQTHDLKVKSEYFDALASGDKCFEVRRDDRGFQKGDKLVLRRFGEEFVNKRTTYLQGNSSATKQDADTYEAEVTYILTGGQFGLEPGFVCMGLKPIN